MQILLDIDDAQGHALLGLLKNHPAVQRVQVQTQPPSLTPPPQPKLAAQEVKRPLWCPDPHKPHAAPLTTKPQTDEHLQIHTDGSCSGNPGPIGMSVVVHTEDTILAAFGWGGGHGTSPQAEVCAVLGALNLAALRKPRQVTIKTDSEYVVTCLNSTSRSYQASITNLANSVWI